MAAIPENHILAKLEPTHADLERQMREEIERAMRIEFEAEKLQFVEELSFRIENEMKEERKMKRAACNANLRSQQNWTRPQFFQNSFVREQMLLPNCATRQVADTPSGECLYEADTISQCARLAFRAPPGLELPPLVATTTMLTPRLLPGVSELGTIGDWDFEAKGDNISRFTFPVRMSVFSSNNRTHALDIFEVTIHNRRTVFQLHVTAEQTSEKRHGWSFNKAGGCGKVEVKCRDENPPDSEVEFVVFIGRGQELGHEPRGPVMHNFSSRPTAGLAAGLERWSFLDAAEPGSEIVFINIEFRNSVNMIFH